MEEALRSGGSWKCDGKRSLIVFSVLAGLSTPSPAFTLFSGWIPRFMDRTRLSVLAHKTELHCLLILVIHHFQIWVSKIKDEKHVVLVLVLQKENKTNKHKPSYWWSLVFLALQKAEWFVLQHDYSKVWENNSSSDSSCEQKLHTDPTGALVVLVIFITNQARNCPWSRQLSVAAITWSTVWERRAGKPWNRDLIQRKLWWDEEVPKSNGSTALC